MEFEYITEETAQKLNNLLKQTTKFNHNKRNYNKSSKDMNENIDLTKILENCPKGTKLYSPLFGEVKLDRIDPTDLYPICVTSCKERPELFSIEGKYFAYFNEAECLLFPSKDQHDWSKFKCPNTKKPKFDPKTLQPFDRVLARIDGGDAYCWFADFVSTPMIEEYDILPCIMSNKDVKMIIPYNEETKHIIGTSDEAPEYYRYWEN